MNDWYLVCFGVAVIFFLFALAHLVMKEKACHMILGYNMKPLLQRKLYDEKKLSRDTMVVCLLFGASFALGGLLCLFVGDWGLWVALGLSLALLVYYVLFHRRPQRFDAKYKRGS